MKKILLILCIVSVMMIAGCKPLMCTQEAKICPDGSAVGRTGPNCEFAACPSNSTQIANPASVNCINKGGTLKIVDGPGGQYGMCTLPDGKQCEEWSYFRGECPLNCSACPQLASPGPDFCTEGKIISGGTDACGCNLSPVCQVTIVDCTGDTKTCLDGSTVNRVPPSCEFAECPPICDFPPCQKAPKNLCGTRRAEVCTEVWQPVCGWFGPNIECFKYPCAGTFSNSCFACMNPIVEYWTDGECPK